MTLVRKRPRLLLVTGVFLYTLTGLSISDVQTLEPAPVDAGACPVPPAERGTADAGEITILQGNVWMLPVRPLLVPYHFSTDRRARLERLIETVRSCRPTVVVLQEVFERPMVDLIARHLPDYRVATSELSDWSGVVNASGLVTLSRLDVERVRFHEFAPLPRGAKSIEVAARKGALAVDVSGGGIDAAVVNVHLYAHRDDQEATVTRAQLAEAVAFVQALRDEGRAVVVAGDFNLGRAELAGGLPPGWRASEHGPTYDPARNPYTVEGANNTPGNHDERRTGEGARTIDFLLTTSADGGAHVRSRVLADLFVSDHQIIHHHVSLGALGASADAGRRAADGRVTARARSAASSR